MHPNTSSSHRLNQIDFVRGLVMIIMALDHVRDFFHETALTANPLDLQTTTTGLFFTRWITHFCAPTFVFLSGVSAYLSGRNKSIPDLSAFLIRRGIWLIIVELTIMNFALSFNPSFNFIMLTVLWAIGSSMILMGIVLRLSPRLILPLGLILFFGHNAISSWVLSDNPAESTWLRILMTGNVFITLDNQHTLGFFYAVLPWTGVMMMGYWIGRYITNRKFTLSAGFLLIVLFIVFRSTGIYGEPVKWETENSNWITFLSFINTTKYPPSLLFLCMTLGPSLLILSIPVSPYNPLSRFASVYGRVPFFYYVLHFYLAHLLGVIAFFLSGYTISQIKDPMSPFLFRPASFGFDLWVVYGVWILVVLILYFPCRWFFQYKLKHRKWWHSYL